MGEDLRELLSYTEDNNPFSQKETAVLIKAIDECKILDPACGSGAFPMGILHKLVHILHKIDPQNKLWKERQIEKAQTIDDPHIQEKLIRSIEEAFDNNELDYGRKLYLIENCIYGVDIQPIAVQIAKLRFFIALIIDQHKQTGRDNLGIQALPNLETKFVAANTLIPIEKPEGQLSFFTYKNPEIDSLEEKLKQLRHHYFNAKTRRNKLKYQNQDKALREELSTLLVGEGWGDQTARQIVAFDPYDQNSSAPFFDMEWMFGIKDGFDIVIGNPPYVSHDKIMFKGIIKDKYKSYEPFADIYCYFIEKSIEFQSRKGILSLITSNSYLRANYGLPVRELLKKENYVYQIINIEETQVFESAIINVCIILSGKKKIFEKTLVATGPLASSAEFISYIESNAYYSNPQDVFSGATWSLGSPKIILTQQKIESIGQTLEEHGTKIRLGIATGYNNAFIIDEQKRKDLIKRSPKNNDIIKPILRGRDIFRYTYSYSGLYLILTMNGINVETEYPDAYKHFETFGDSFKNRGAQGQHWTNLRACSFFDDFKKEKIVWIELSDVNRFALCTEELYLLNSAYFLIPPSGINIKYLLGILNSKVIKFYLNLIAETSGMGTKRWINNYVKSFPIPVALQKQQDQIISLVDQVLNAKRENVLIDTREIEEAIDCCIYDLYKLSKEEIILIE